MKLLYWFTIIAPFSILSNARAQDLPSGPEKGIRLPVLKVLDLTGEHKDKEVDYTTERKERLTVYLFIDAEKWDRPMARFLRTLESAIQKENDDAYTVAVWLTANTDQTKEYLPRAQKSLQLHATALCSYVGEKIGPKEWCINGDAHLTVVVAHKQKVVATIGYRAVNETDVPAVCEAMKRAREGK